MVILLTEKNINWKSQFDETKWSVKLGNSLVRDDRSKFDVISIAANYCPAGSSDSTDHYDIHGTQLPSVPPDILWPKVGTAVHVTDAWFGCSFASFNIIAISHCILKMIETHQKTL